MRSPVRSVARSTVIARCAARRTARHFDDLPQFPELPTKPRRRKTLSARRSTHLGTARLAANVMHDR